MGQHSEVFIGTDTSKLRNAVAIADGVRGGEVRRVKIAFASSCPQQATFAIAYHRLRSIVLEARLRHDAA